MSKAKQKGTLWESKVVSWLREQGFPTVERKALTGAHDQGDLTGIPGLMVEAKNVRAISLSQWSREMAAQVDNSGAELGLLCVKKVGTTDPGQAYWLIHPAHVPAVIRAMLLEGQA